MKSKLFKLFSLVVLILLGISFGLAQNQPGTNFSRTTPPDSAFQVWTKLGNNTVETGYDTTTYVYYGTLTATNSSFTVRGASWGNNSYTNAGSWTRPTAPVNICEWNGGVLAGGNKYIRIFQGDFAPKFKFYNKDTLFLTFASRNSNYRTRFQFDSSKAIKVYTADQSNLSRENYLPWFHVLRIKPQYGNPAFEAQWLAAGMNVATYAANPGNNNVRLWSNGTYNVINGVATFNGLDSLKTKSNYGGNIDNNTATFRGFNPDTLMMVFDSILNTTATGFPNLYISDLYVQGLDSLLQGRALGVTDTLLMAVGRGPDAYSDGAAYNTKYSRAPGVVLQNGLGTPDYRVYIPTHVEAAGGGTWALATRRNAGGAVQAYGATPIAKFTLLPGAAKFVRWNVGFDPDWGWTGVYPAGRIDATGKLVPTHRRQHVRVRHQPVDGALGGNDGWAFKASDTCTIIDSGHYAPATQTRDTLYIFDADSNITLDSVGVSTVSSTILSTTGLNALDSLLSNSVIFPYSAVKVYQTQVSPRGRVVIDWQMTKISGQNYRCGFRLVKVRLATNLAAIGIQDDTLNAQTSLRAVNPAALLSNAYFAQSGVSGVADNRGLTGYVDSTVLFRAARPSKIASLQYKKDSTINTVANWTNWTGAMPVSRTEVAGSATNPFSWKAVVTDTFNNNVDAAVVGIKADVNTVVWDSNYKNVTASIPAWHLNGTHYGLGSRVYNPLAAGPDQPSRTVPGTTTFTLFARNNSAINNAWDDNGTVGAHLRFFNPCLLTINFTFYLYTDLDTTNLAAPRDWKPINSWYQTYARTATGSSSGVPTYLRVSPNTFNGVTFARSLSYPITPDTVQTTTVDLNGYPATNPYARNLDTLELTVTDDCERPVVVNDTNAYTWNNPVLIMNKGPYSSIASLLLPGERRDTLGLFISKFIPTTGNPDNNKIRFIYRVPNVRRCTVSISAKYVADPTITDNMIVRTVSGEPKQLALVRPNASSPIFPGNDRVFRTTTAASSRPPSALADSILYASSNDLYRGFAGTYNPAYNTYVNTYTAVKGETRDINGDTVDGAGSAGKTIQWKLLTPIAATSTVRSLKLADASYIFGEDANGTPKFGFSPVKTFAEALAAGKASNLNTLNVGIAGDGNAYILLVTDQVGGGGGILGSYASHHVFPAEKANVFPGTFTEGVDSVYQFLSNDGVNYTTISSLVDKTSPWFHPAGVKDNGRGFNQLIANFEGNTIDYTNDPAWTNGRRPLIYHVIPDTSHDLRIAWVDISGDLFNTAAGDVNDKAELKGRQTAKVVNSYTSTTNETTLRRLVIKGSGNTGVVGQYAGAPNYNYSGNINNLYVREYDRFGNPVVRTDWRNNITLGLRAHVKRRLPYCIPFGLSNNKDVDQTNVTYYDYAATGRTRFAGVIDSSGVVIPWKLAAGAAEIVPGGAAWLTTQGVFNVIPATYKRVLNDTGTPMANLRQLRGAVAFKYQTIWVDTTAAAGRVPNVSDTAIFFAQTTKCAFPDTALVASKDFTMYPMAVNVTPQAPTVDVVGGTVATPGSPATYVAGTAGTGRTIGTNVRVLSPDGYVMPWFNLTTAGPGGQPIISNAWLAVNLFQIVIDTAGLGQPQLSLKGNDQVAGFGPRWVKNPDPPIYDMPGFDKTTNMSFVRYSHTAAAQPLYIPGTGLVAAANLGLKLVYNPASPRTSYAGGGWLTGTTLYYKGYRDGLYKLKITQLNPNMPVTEYMFQDVFRFYPDGAHFVSMTNPVSSHPELEPTVGTNIYPVRANYFTNGGQYNPDKLYVKENARFDTLMQYNGFFADAYNYNPPNDIRNYSSSGTTNNVDTIFYGQNYTLKLRVFDRFGNLIHKPKLWLQHAVSFGQPFPSQNIITNKQQVQPANEWEVQVDTNNNFTEVSLADDLIVRFVYDANLGTPDGVAGQFMLKYTPFSQNASLIAPDAFNLWNGHDLAPNDRVMSFRNIYLKLQKAPGVFDMVTGNLVRIGHGAATYVPSWSAAASTNLQDDGITYQIVVKRSASDSVVYNVGAPTQYALDSTKLVTDLALTTANPNRTVDMYVIATNRWGLTRRSTSVKTVTFELDVEPTVTVAAPTAPVVINGSTTYTLNVDATDGNGIAYGTTAPKTITSHGVTYPNANAQIDSIYYQVTLNWVRSFPANVAPNSIPKVDTIAGGNPWKTYTNAELWALLGSEDSATYAITVKAVDRKVTTNVYDFETWGATATGTMTITKIDNNYYVKFTQDSAAGKAMYKNSVLNLAVTDQQTIKVTGYDSNNDIIRGFKNLTDGSATPSIKFRINVVQASTAPVDALQTKVITYTTQTGDVSINPAADGTFSIPLSIFDMGVGTFKFQDRRANEKVNISILASDNPTLFKMEGVSKEGKELQLKLNNSDTTLIYNMVPGPVVKLKTTVTPRRSGVVFLLKAMEVIITPLDLYNNEVLTLSTGINAILAVDDDVVEHDQVGNRIIFGKTYIYLTPMVVHDIPNLNVLKVGAFLPDPISGLPNPTTGAFKDVLVVHHMPAPPAVSTFKITTDVTGGLTGDKINMKKHSDKYIFSWGPAKDSNDAPLKKSFASDPNDKRFWIEDQCVVKYTFKIYEYMNYTFVNSADTSKSLTVNAGQLKDIYLHLRQGVSKSVFVNYFIICEDDVYKYSMPLYADKLVTAKKQIELYDDGITAVKDPSVAPTVYSIDQNFPNPFNPTTNISYQLPKESNVKLVIYNILGQPVRTLVNDRQNVGYYNYTWDGKDDRGISVSSGTYIYTITAGEFVQTKKMNLLK